MTQFTKVVPSHSFIAAIQEGRDSQAIVAELKRQVRSVVALSFVAMWFGDIEVNGASNGSLQLRIDPGDPLLTLASERRRAFSLGDVGIDSAGMNEARVVGATLFVPLIALGELIGLIALGPSTDGGALAPEMIAELEQIAALTAAALRAASLAEQQAAAERVWRNTAEELRIAQTIQRSLLPERLPERDGWRFDAHYQPARVVGGDLYDFIELPGDLLGFIFGDASDKSIPAALLMATTRTLLRAAAKHLVLPGQTLARANDDLCAQIPPGMFVTCFIAILESSTGRLRFANAGHCPPVVHAPSEITELRASGWPLGMMPGAAYDEGEITLEPGTTLVCYSDGLSETHNAAREMFGGAGLVRSIQDASGGPSHIAAILSAHRDFAGPNWEQEDDLTLVSISRDAPAPIPDAEPVTLAEFDVPSAPDIERDVAERVVAAASGVPLTPAQIDRLRTAVAESVMNAAEHGNRFRPDLPVSIRVVRSGESLIVRIADRGGSGPLPVPAMPDLDAKLAGLQSPRGWGLFLIERMVDRMAIVQTPEGHAIELTFFVEDRTESNR